jgi:ribosomal protein S18 acetylase RimI-like enzyme
VKTSAGPERVALRDGREVLLRRLRRRDLEEATRFANSLVRERAVNPDLGILLDTRVTIAEERKWLAGKLAGIESGDCFSVCAQAEGHIVGNCEVLRRGFKDEHHVGVFGIAILPSYRQAGLGRMMMERVLREAGDAGISIVELDVFSNN